MDVKIVPILYFLFTTIVTTSIGLDPYKPGPYKTAEFTVSPSIDKSPLSSTIYFPLKPGVYSVIVFLGGMYALIPATVYSVLLQDVASHGFVVVGMNRLGSSAEHLEGVKGTSEQISWMVKDPAKTVMQSEDRLHAEGDTFLKQYLWLRDNINNRTSALPDWGRSALMCHSASCDDILLMANRSRHLVKATLFLDPVAFHIKEVAPFHEDIKVLTFMSQRSEQLPQCCIPGVGWKAIYKLFSSIKVRMEVKDFGHCDILDPFFWEGCHAIHFCVTTNDTYIAKYKRFASGVVTGFMQWAVEGDVQMEPYVTDPSRMPLPLIEIEHQDK